MSNEPNPSLASFRPPAVGQITPDNKWVLTYIEQRLILGDNHKPDGKVVITEEWTLAAVLDPALYGQPAPRIVRSQDGTEFHIK